MLIEILTKALNDQVNAEYYSAYLYHSMSAFAEHTGFKGAANWLFMQAKEEMAHGINIYQYILDRGAVPVLSDIVQPPGMFVDMKGIFKLVLEHERSVTERIKSIAALANYKNDEDLSQFMEWYVHEQEEEEESAEEILNKFEAADGDKKRLSAIDDELAVRVFHNPFPKNKKLSGA